MQVTWSKDFPVRTIGGSNWGNLQSGLKQAFPQEDNTAIIIPRIIPRTAPAKIDDNFFITSKISEQALHYETPVLWTEESDPAR